MICAKCGENVRVYTYAEVPLDQRTDRGTYTDELAWAELPVCGYCHDRLKEQEPAPVDLAALARDLVAARDGLREGVESTEASTRDVRNLLGEAHRAERVICAAIAALPAVVRAKHEETGRR